MKKHLLKSLLLMATMAVGANAWAADPDLENDYTLVKSVTWGEGDDITRDKENQLSITAYETGNKKQQALYAVTAPEGAVGWIGVQLTNSQDGKGWWNRSGQGLWCYNAQRSAAVYGDDLTTGWLVVFTCTDAASNVMTLTNGNGEPDGTFTYTASEDNKSYYCTITAEENAYVGFCGNRSKGYIKSISVYKPNKTVVMTTYTVKFVDQDNEELKDAVQHDGVAGQVPTLTDADKANIVVEDMVFVYESDDAAELVIAEDASTVVTAKFRLAENLDYVVNEVCDDNVVRTTTGTSYETSTVKVPYRKYNVLDGKLYSKGDTGKEYNYSFTLTTETQTSNLTYAATGAENIVFISEGEDIDGLVVCNSANTGIRSSNSSSAYAPANTVITNLPAGKYKIYATIYDASKSPDSYWTFLADAVQVASLHCTAVNIQELTSDEFAIGRNADIILAKGGNNNMGLDLIYIQKTGDVTDEEAAALNEAADAAAALAAAKADLQAAIDEAKAIDTEDKEGVDALNAAIAAAEAALAAEDATVESLNAAEEALAEAEKAFFIANASDLLKQAIALAEDDEAVAVGKLKAAIIEVTDEGADEDEVLVPAVEQFKKDNADQENDQTAKVAIDGWKKFETNDAAGVCATRYAPAITTYDGRENVQMREVYEGTCATTGQIIYQNITGLENGLYKVGFYANAFSTAKRDGMECDLPEEGADDVAYVFANDQKAFVNAIYATETTENSFRTFDVEVTDGTIKLGMGKEKAGSNWHIIQIYQLTWFTTAKAVFALHQAELKTLVAEAEALAAEEYKTEGQEAFADAISNAQLAIDSEWYNIEEVEQIIADLKDAIEAFKVANYFVFEGEAYIIDAESGLFVAAGHDWGTRAIVNEIGLDLTFTAAENNRVIIDTKVGGGNHFLGSNLYMDATAYGWALEYRGFGFYITNGTQYISLDANNNLVMSDTPREWIIVTKEGVTEQRLEEMADASKNYPVDATWLLQNPNFNRDDQRVSAWVVSEDCTNKNLNGGAYENHCAESYHSVFTISQTIEGAPAGTYQLTAQGFYRQDGDTEEEAPYFFISTSEDNIANAVLGVLENGEGNMDAASASFTSGLYTSEGMGVYVAEGETLTIGVKGTATSQWVIFDNFQLTYYGSDQVKDYITTAITEVNSTARNAAEATYNLAGQRVAKAQNGLYIVAGKKVVK